MKLKTFSILIFILPALLPLTASICFHLRQQQVRHEMKERLEELHHQVLVIPATEIKWIEDHEIWVEGKMFDIHEYTVKDGNYILKGLFDEDETRLVKDLVKDQQPDKKDNKKLSSIFHLLKQLDQPEISATKEIRPASNSFNGFLSFFIPDIFSRVIIPPPRSC